MGKEKYLRKMRKSYFKNENIMINNIIILIMSKNSGDTIVILDQSGSMSSMGSEPIQSVQLIVDENKHNNIKFTLVTFNNLVTWVINDQPINQVSIDEKSYNPMGQTALNDAICKTIYKKLGSSRQKDVVLIIITDGIDNCSQKYSTITTKDLINFVKTEHNWEVNYIGANINVFKEGLKINIDRKNCLEYKQNISGSLMRACRTVSGTYHPEQPALKIKENGRSNFQSPQFLANSGPPPLLPLKRTYGTMSSNRTNSRPFVVEPIPPFSLLPPPPLIVSSKKCIKKINTEVEVPLLRVN